MKGDVAVNATIPRMGEGGKSLTRASEGLATVAYRDPGGVWTLGYGRTKGIRAGMTCTKTVAEAWLDEDLCEAEATIHRFVAPAVIAILPPAAWDALTDFVFNLGPQAFRNPKTGTLTGVARALEARDWAEVPRQFKRWVYDNGVKLRGLELRREAEAAMWNSADWRVVG